MLRGLQDAIEQVEIPADAVSITAVLAAADRLAAKISAAVAEFDGEAGWAYEGATSMTAWLRDRRMRSGTAARLARTAKTLRHLPVIRTAWQDGTLSSGQVDVIVTLIPARHLLLFAEHEAGLVPTLSPLSVEEVAAVIRAWIRWADALDDGAEPEDRPGTAHLSPALDGRGRLDANLDPEGFALAATALRIADPGDLDRPAAERRGAALKTVLRFFLDNHDVTTAGSRHRPHLNATVDWDAFNQTGELDGYLTETGIRLHSSVLSKLLCDCNINRVITRGASVILDYGTTTQQISAPLWNALVLRDRHCRFPGCDRPPKWTQAHHAQWFTRNGPTKIGNLVLECDYHHHLLHKPGWDSTLTADGVFTVHYPDGTVRTTYPPGTRQPRFEPREPPARQPQPPPVDHRTCPTAEETSAWAQRLQELHELRDLYAASS